MLETLAHRGPDDTGSFVSDEMTLGARRLAIIDVAGGHQPVTNEDGSIVAALNGEIYNTAELRRLLARRGHSFRSAVDTELIPHLYEEFGARFVGLVRGMFAIALWDELDGRLLLARDRAGEKPLLYARTPDGLTFASELKALLLDPAVTRKLDHAALRMYLTLQYVPGGGTIVAGVERLPAGHLLVEEDGNHRIERYWDLVPGTEAHARSRPGAVRELRERLEDAVAAQMHADVPVGALLSGGVDSAGVVALMRHVSGTAPRTFTVGFEHAPFDEREAARSVARALGTEHTELVVGPPSLAELERFAWHLDEPVADQAALPTYLIAQVASEHVKVVLTGEGSDELFGGYPRYAWFERAERLAGLPAPLRAVGAAVASRSGRSREAALLFGSGDALERHVSWTQIFGRDDADRLLEPTVAGDGFAETTQLFARMLEGWRDRSVVEQVMYLDFKTWLPDDILTKADRMTMAASIEARAPYLDQRVIEFAGSLPVTERLRGRETKPLLRAALADLLPDSALRRRKASFRVPVEQWLGEQLRDTFGELLLDPAAATAPYLQRAETERLVTADGHALGGRRLWSLVVLELWLQGVYSVRPVVADPVAT
jgi:asparagine synthase (glutamine-hydrolysing)